MSTSHNPLRDSRLHRTGATLTRHAGRLKQGALLLAALAAIYAIWLSVGLPALPITRGHAPGASGTPFVTQVDALTTPRIDTSALLTSRQVLPKRIVRVAPRAVPHAARPASPRPASHQPGGPAATTSPAPEHLGPPDARGPAKSELTAETPAAPAAVKTSTTPTTPAPPTPTPPPTITLPQLPEVQQVPQVPQFPQVPQVPPLPQTPELPEIPPAPQVPLPNLPQAPAVTTPALPQLP